MNPNTNNCDQCGLPPYCLACFNEDASCHCTCHHDEADAEEQLLADHRNQAHD